VASSDKDAEVAQALLKALIDTPLLDTARRKGDLLSLPDMTAVRVLAYGFFAVWKETDRRRRWQLDDERYIPFCDMYYVEVIEGQHRGKKVWVHHFDARVPDSKPFKLDLDSQALAKESVESGHPTVESGEVQSMPLDKTERSIGQADNANTRVSMGEDRSRTAAKERSTRRGATAAVAPNAKLELTDLVVNPNAVTKMAAISGRFRNTSQGPLSSLMVTIAVEDQAGKLLRSFTWFCLPSTIEPGEVGTFETIVENDPAADAIKLYFKDIYQAIPWIDRSGKNAHQ
jgi:hypothetical protein